MPTNKKLKRRLQLLDDALDYVLRSRCKFAMCNGPFAPIRHMQTCVRCAVIHRAMQMGLVTSNIDGHFTQVSVIDGARV